MNYQETIQYLYDRLPVFHFEGVKAYKPGLGKSIEIMKKLGNPQNSYKTIHIGGTNGKGSVSHFLSAVLQEAGYRVGLYTSPHLVDFGERIRVDGEQLDKQYVIGFVEKNFPMLEEKQPSFFEATMAMAFDYFAVKQVDVAIIEVGLGGRLDSTNIILPELSVITNVSMDHVQFLGNSLVEIAYEKSGIIKKEVPVVIGETTAETAAVFLQKATEMAASITFVNTEKSVEFLRNEDGMLVVKSRVYGEVFSGLPGMYQLKNLATLFEVIEQLLALGFNISNEQVRAGVKNVVKLTGLMGRWQGINSHPRIILDTGHNLAAFEYIATQLKAEECKSLRFVLGMASDKVQRELIELLPGHAIYYFTAATGPRSEKPEKLLELAQHAGLNGAVFATVPDAILQAQTDADADDLIFIGGSNFVVGEALQFLQQSE